MRLNIHDRLDIQELIHRCNWANDSGNSEEWSDCFEPEGQFDSLGGTITGRPALARFAEQVWSGSDPAWSRFRGSMHCINNLAIDGNSDRAHARCYLFILAPTVEHEAKIILVGHYSDELRKVDGRWYFSKRVLRHWPSDAVHARIDVSAAHPSS